MTTLGESRTPLVIAHRGASRAYAENTLAAFRGAVEQGADWVELDVRRTADGQLVIHHDADVRLAPASHDGSVTTALRPICRLSRSSLPDHIPDLGPALAACEHLGVNVEVKELPGEPGHDPHGTLAHEVAAALVASGRPTSSLLVSSFDLAFLDQFAELDSGMPTALLCFGLPARGVSGLVDVVAGRGHRALHPIDELVDEELVSVCHDAGLAVNVWTVDDPQRQRALAG